ncbi:hypothetical protein D3C86_1173280 [compost metagenome]
MSRAASSESTSGEMQLTSWVMKSCTLALLRSTPLATARTAMSRSVMMPTSFSGCCASSTGITPVSASCIRWATSGKKATEVTHASFPFSVIRSRIRISPLLSHQDWPHFTQGVARDVNRRPVLASAGA